MKGKEESEKTGLKTGLKVFNIQKTKIMAFGPSLMANRQGKSGNAGRFFFLGLKNHC